MKKYKCLNKQVFVIDEFQLVPIRYKDRYKIMKWRNDQIYHLRQKDILTKSKQDLYFGNVVSKQFDLQKPDQLLFSFLKKDICLGYGGLVHLNWTERNAEVSFVMDTNQEALNFVHLWNIFLTLLKQVVFKYLSFHKIYTYAYDLRPKLYDALSQSGFKFEGRLEDHCLVDSKFHDVLYHSCINPIESLRIRGVKKEDSIVLFEWSNDPLVRRNAFDSKKIDWDSHEKWFQNKLLDNNCKIFIFENKQGHPVGQVRLDYLDKKWLIDYSIDQFFRGLGLGKKIISKAINMIDKGTFMAMVKHKNQASIKTFLNLGFKNISQEVSFKNFEFIK
uniref:GNAT family acetyltransferase n=1 Tax=uncultured Flavobacteriia bacterium TaxID=212695 RepID=H6REM8_9BACT|nr:N-Acetylneuraminate cytidylyltransferase [uncultured bacterium]CCF99489.1 GNAT family acetyltransferase [uncultured Flavobacteriia bacterium]